jgi:deoxyribodipyrimidine photo-lyase
MTGVPEIRVRRANPTPPRADGDFVLYWMIAARRARRNFALERAVEWARRLDKPLVVLEALRCDYPWASDRLHRFVLDGMADNRRAFERTAVLYHPYVEPTRDAGRGLLETLAGRACVVVTDEFPGFFLPRMVAAAAPRVPVLLEAVDSNGLLPLAAAATAASTAFAFRRTLQRDLPAHLPRFPRVDPLARVALPRLPALPREIARRWPRASGDLLEGKPAALAALPIDHRVVSAPSRGGAAAGRAALRSFLAERLPRYADARNHPDDDATSGLSAYLHFGHVSAHEVFAALAEREGWSAERLATRATGSRTGWWGMSASAESFLDQFVTWREMGYNFCFHRNDADRVESLPTWARRTLTPLLAGATRRGRHPRPDLERRAAAAPARGAPPQLPAHALGQEDPGVVADARGRGRPHDRAQRSLRARRARPELVRGDLLVPRTLRPPVGTGATDLRYRSLHEQRQHGAEGSPAAVPEPVRAVKPPGG